MHYQPCSGLRCNIAQHHLIIAESGNNKSTIAWISECIGRALCWLFVKRLPLATLLVVTVVAEQLAYSIYSDYTSWYFRFGPSPDIVMNGWLVDTWSRYYAAQLVVAWSAAMSTLVQLRITILASYYAFNDSTPIQRNLGYGVMLFLMAASQLFNFRDDFMNERTDASGIDFVITRLLTQFVVTAIILRYVFRRKAELGTARYNSLIADNFGNLVEYNDGQMGAVYHPARDGDAQSVVFGPIEYQYNTTTSHVVKACNGTLVVGPLGDTTAQYYYRRGAEIYWYVGLADIGLRGVGLYGHH